MRKLLISLLLCAISVSWAIILATLTSWSIDDSFRLPFIQHPLEYLRVDGVEPMEGGLKSFDYVIADRKHRCVFRESNGEGFSSIVCECPSIESDPIDRCLRELRKAERVRFPTTERLAVVWGNHVGEDELAEEELTPGPGERLLRYAVGVAVAIALFFLPAWRIVQWRDEIRLLATSKYWLALGGCVSVLLLVVSMFLVFVVDAGCIDVSSAENRDGISAETEFPEWVMYLGGWVAVLILAFFEELVFRGFLLPRLQRNVGVGLAIMLSNVAFASIHIPGVDAWRAMGQLASCETGYLDVAFFPFLAGLVFGWFRWRFGSVLLVTIAHALWNGAIVPIVTLAMLDVVAF